MNGPPIIGGPKFAPPAKIQGPDGSMYDVPQVAITAIHDGITYMLVQEITRNVVWNITERLKDRCHYIDADMDRACWITRAAHNDPIHEFAEPPAPKEADAEPEATKEA